MVRKKAEQKKGSCLKSGKTFIGRGPRQDGARHGPEGARPEGSMSPRLQVGYRGCPVRGEGPGLRRGPGALPLCFRKQVTEQLKQQSPEAASAPKVARPRPQPPAPDPRAAQHSPSPSPTTPALTRARGRRGSGTWASPSISRRPQCYN